MPSNLIDNFSNYQRTVDTKHDLAEIADYTLKNWGLKIFEEYRDGRKTVFQGLANH